jgi:hypothetical protein
MAEDIAEKSPEAAQSSALLSNAQLMPADLKKGYGTPYYAAYTNDGDMAGAVMVAEGQKVRLVDKLTGDVVYEGVGPAAAQVATATANAISKDKGRGAAWAIQKPTEEGGWVSMAEERYDPKKQGFWGKLADFALPVLGAILAPMTGGLSLGLTGALGTAAGDDLGRATPLHELGAGQLDLAGLHRIHQLRRPLFLDLLDQLHLMAVIEEVTAAYEKARTDQTFLDELDRLQTHYAGRPSPIYEASRLSEHAGGAPVNVPWQLITSQDERQPPAG